MSSGSPIGAVSLACLILLIVYARQQRWRTVFRQWHSIGRKVEEGNVVGSVIEEYGIDSLKEKNAIDSLKGESVIDSLKGEDVLSEKSSQNIPLYQPKLHNSQNRHSNGISIGVGHSNVVYRLNFAESSDRVEHSGVSWPIAERLEVHKIGPAVVLKDGLIGGLKEAQIEPFAFNKWYWKKDVSKLKHEGMLERLEEFSSKEKCGQKENGGLQGLEYFSFLQIFQEHFQHVAFDSLPKAALLCEFLSMKFSGSNQKILVRSITQRDLILAVCPKIVQGDQILTRMLSFDEIVVGAQSVQACSILVPVFRRTDSQELQMGMTQQGIWTPLGSSKSESVTLKVVYLSRGQSGRRGVRNEDSVLKTIRGVLKEWKGSDTKKNFDFSVPELVNDWKSDRNFFENADVIIGPHGGAISNIIFGCPKTKVIEFLPLVSLRKKNQNSRPCYFGLALSLGMAYAAVEPDSVSKNFFDIPMNIPEERVKLVLQEAIGTSGTSRFFVRGGRSSSQAASFLVQEMDGNVSELASSAGAAIETTKEQLLNWVVLVIVGSGFQTMLENWTRWFLKLQSKNFPIYLVCEDFELFQHYEKDGRFFKVSFVDVSHNNSDASAAHKLASLGGGSKHEAAHNYDTSKYKKLVSRRATHLLGLLKIGINIVYTDIDTVWLKDPRSYFDESRSDKFSMQNNGEGCPIFGQVDSRSYLGHTPYFCTGFLAVQATKSNVKFIEQWEQSLTKKSQLNQPIFNTIRKKMGSKICPLPMEAFPPGSSFFKGDVAARVGTLQKATGFQGSDAHDGKVAVVHNNFIQGFKNKVARFRMYSLWEEERKR